MLYLVLGGQKENIDKEIKKFALDSDIVRMDEFSFDPDLIVSSIESNSLFGFQSEETYVLKNISLNEEAFRKLLKLTQVFVEASKKILIVEEKMLKAEIDLFKKQGASISDLREKKAVKEKSGFSGNPFALADFLGKRSPKDAWIEYVKQIMIGNEPEMIHGSLVAKVRDMLSSSRASADELGIHPFVYSKAKADSKNWNEKELQNLYEKLLVVYHKSRSGGDDLDIGIEKIILSI